jgi:hypothetical protein
MTGSPWTIPTDGPPAVPYGWPIARVSTERDTNIQRALWRRDDYETYEPVTRIVVSLEPAATSPFMDF